MRIGTCSWADEGLVKHWYPRGVSSPAARLAYYAERFDTVEVDSPFYRLPSPETAAKWAERTPDDFVWHAKASAAMTGHEEADRETAFREFREAFAPLEASGKLRGVLLQYHPRFQKSRRGEGGARGRARRCSTRCSPSSSSATARGWRRTSGPTRSRSSRPHGLAYVSVDSPRTRASNVMPRVAAATARSPTSASTAGTGRPGTSAAPIVGRPVRLDVLEGGARGVGRAAARARRQGRRGLRADEQQQRATTRPKRATLLRGLLDEHGIEATGGVEPAQIGAVRDEAEHKADSELSRLVRGDVVMPKASMSRGHPRRRTRAAASSATSSRRPGTATTSGASPGARPRPSRSSATTR